MKQDEAESHQNTTGTTFTNYRNVHNQAAVQNIGGSVYHGPVYNTHVINNEQTAFAPSGSDLDPQIQRQRRLEALKFSYMTTRHDAIRSAHARTCRWVLDTVEYRWWIDDNQLNVHHGFMWIRGKPATGKSTITKFLLTHTKTSGAGIHVISFFFNARGDALEKSTAGMYRSLLVQLFDVMPDLLTVLDTLSPSTVMTGETAYNWTVETLEQLLRYAVERLDGRSLICFIDALDETDEDDAREMVHFFEELGLLALSRNFSFRTCFSSRHFPHITIDNGLTFKLEDQDGHHNDLMSYLATELRIGRNQRAQQIRHEIMQRASGIFLWVVLVVQILNKEYDRGRVHTLKQRLQEIPNGLEALIHDILTRDGPPDEELRICLRWTLFSQRPLSLTELYHAVVFEADGDVMEQSDIDETTQEVMGRFVLHCSRGLIEETKGEPKIVQFIHETIRDYLFANVFSNEPMLQKFGSPDGSIAQIHDALTACCHSYHHTAYKRKTSDIPPATLLEVQADSMIRWREGYNKEFPLLEYAVFNMLKHSEMAHKSGVSQQTFLRKLDLVSWVRHNNILATDNDQRYTGCDSLLQILAEWNLPYLITTAVELAPIIDMPGSRHGCPLFAASIKGYRKAVMAMLSPSYFIATEKHSSSLPQQGELVIKAVDILVKASYALLYASSALGWACDRDEVDLVKCLLASHKVDVNAETTFGFGSNLSASEDYTGLQTVMTPLYCAVRNGSLEIVRLMFQEDGILLDTKATYWNKTFPTPLHLAVYNDDVDMVRLLLTKPGFGINRPDNDGWTPLELANIKGQRQIAEMLIAYQSDFENAIDSEYTTALQTSGKQSSPDIPQ